MFIYAQFLVQERVCTCSCYAHFTIFSFFKKIPCSLKLFLICSYFLGNLNLTGLIKCVLNKKKVYLTRKLLMEFLQS